MTTPTIIPLTFEQSLAASTDELYASIERLRAWRLRLIHLGINARGAIERSEKAMAAFRETRPVWIPDESWLNDPVIERKAAA